jgi:hypothetical protein
MRFSFPSLREASPTERSANRKALPTASIMRVVIFILSLGLSLSIGMTSIQATMTTEKFKGQSSLDLSWLPVIIFYLFIFYLIAAHGKIGCLILTATILLLTGQYGAAFLCIFLVIGIVFSTSSSSGNLNPDEYDDIG